MSKVKYGILGYNTINIGDDIQSLVASKLIKPSYIVNRDNYDLIYDMGGKLCDLHEDIKLIMNGWFMHNDNWRTGNKNIKFPIKNRHIQPIYISTCLSKDVPLLYSDECVEHYKKHSPILCRDKTTLDLLKNKNVDVEFFGCLTQLLNAKDIPDSAESEKYKDSTIYIGNPLRSSRECRELYERCKKQDKKCFYFNHYSRGFEKMNPVERFDFAHGLLSKYKCASKIYTSMLHAFLPCRAMGLDVEFVGSVNYRTENLIYQTPNKHELREKFYKRIGELSD